jgi:hypothetical protein
MKRQQINVRLTLQDRERLERILNSKTTTQHDKLKAQVLLLTDIGEYGSRASSNDVVIKLNISPRSVGRIRGVYAKNSSIEDLFRFTGLSDQSTHRCSDQNSKSPQRRNSKYVEIDNSSNETFLVEHIKCRVTLTKEEREILQNVVNTGKQTTRKFNRAKILLLADEGIDGPAMSDLEITDKLNVSVSTVSRLRRLFITKGQIEDVLSFNHNKAGRTPKVDGIVQATLIAQVCSKPPEGRCRWTLRLLADRLIELNVVESISHIAVGNALKKMNLSLGNEKNG